ncbi:hypothetical protein IEQ34_021756 [Dendrobium chrysotoxum]|uniref:Uncharacterized protein n=1 Tax=Dendrobium chrysotoxum TaxID=161865 RepID=A0AAV7FN88_DENCH|nr:hypothetical protein IEQ34_021756 [Dendrobium chrysotoxum]
MDSLFDIRQESPIILVWICFLNLRLHISSSYCGRSKPFTARVLMAMDVTKCYPKEIRFGPHNLGYLKKSKLKFYHFFVAIIILMDIQSSIVLFCILT